MSLQDIFRSVTERIEGTANVHTVYGEPITAEGRTIIPVAKVRYGFGGGFGEGNVDEAQRQGGGGGGGGVEVKPIGIIEITPEETRYISFEDRGRLIRAGIAVGLIAMFILGRMLLRRN